MPLSIQRKYKIGIIGSFKNLWDEEYIAQAFEKLGHQVIRFDWQNASAEMILERELDFILTVKRDIEGYEKLLGKVKTVYWLFDLFWGTPREAVMKYDIKMKSDFVFSTDGGHNKEFKDLDINHYLLRQSIWDEDVYLTEPDLLYPEEIVFVGTNNSWWNYRQRLISFLQRIYGRKFKRYGLKGQDEIRGDDLNRLYNSAKIVVGDSVYSPYYWSNRVYDVLGRGGFLIHPKIPGLEQEFEYYKHFVPYDINNFQQLREIIDYYLIHDLERNKIRLKGFQYCKDHHTTTKRCQEILKTIGQKNIGTKGRI